ncbi:TIR domain-containing protein [Dactylosporangium sp. NPDC049525]|uniref:TIR domain-containing protein n=1 Tax=Dactylosporangium sp. NPDC049525 TaxID=3154730 RepID=UPI00341A2B7C
MAVEGHIFISYAHADRGYVEAVVEHLRDQGLTVFHDAEIATGERWATVLEERIDTCRAVVVVMSIATKTSRWVEVELDHARKRGKPIFPLLLSGEPLFGTGPIQYESVVGGQLPSSRFVELLRTITPSPPHASAEADTPPSDGRDVIRQLPPRAADFTGRDDLVGAVMDALKARPRPPVNLYGLPGSGKTTIAVEVAARLGPSRGDTQLYFDLAADDVEGWLGRALGRLGFTQSELPPGAALRGQEFRDRLHRRRPLVFIDNATSSADLWNLLPGQSDAVVLVASREPIYDLPGIRQFPVEPMAEDEAVAFLRAVSGRDEPDQDKAVRAVARITGYLPLAIRIVGALIRARPHWAWSDLVDRLGTDGGATKQPAIRRALEAAYRDLDRDSALGFRLLGLAPAPDMNVGLAMATLAADGTYPRDVFDRLAVRQLLRVEGDVCRMHRLLWMYASELALSLDSDERRNAVERMTAWAVRTLDTTYAAWLSKSSNRAPIVVAYEQLDLPLSEVYVEGQVSSADLTGDLAGMWQARQRLVLVGAGGSGKTTMVNHLSTLAAHARLNGRDTLLPVVLFARDVKPEDDYGSLTELLVRSLRQRAGVDLPSEVLDFVFKPGRLGVIIDGLDEVVDEPARLRLVHAIEIFAQQSDAAILVTTRPQADLPVSLTGFGTAFVQPWDPATGREYLRRLAARLPIDPSIVNSGLAELLELRDTIGDPLALQLFAMQSRWGNLRARSATALLEAYVGEVLTSRELSRVRSQISVDSTRRLLTTLALTLQTSASDRVSAPMEAIEAMEPRFGPPLRLDRFERQQVLETVARRSSALHMYEFADGQVRVSFSHTAFREYLAASALLDPDWPAPAIVDLFGRHNRDASWTSVLLAFAELVAGGSTGRDSAAWTALTELVGRYPDQLPHQLREAVGDPDSD